MKKHDVRWKTQHTPKNVTCVKKHDARQNIPGIIGTRHVHQKNQHISYSFTYIVNMHVSLSNATGRPFSVGPGLNKSFNGVMAIGSDTDAEYIMNVFLEQGLLSFNIKTCRN